MIVSDENQARVFLINIIFGIICIAVFDLFQVLIKRYGKKTYIIVLLDIAHLVISFVTILYASVKYNLGALRYYQVIGILTGVFLARVTISRIDSKIFEALIVFGGKVIRIVVKILLKPVLFVLRVIFFLIEVIEQKTIRWCHKVVLKTKKVKEKNVKKKKTVKKRLKMI